MKDILDIEIYKMKFTEIFTKLYLFDLLCFGIIDFALCISAPPLIHLRNRMTSCNILHCHTQSHFIIWLQLQNEKKTR